jgi:hypothetical protein
MTAKRVKSRCLKPKYKCGYIKYFKTSSNLPPPPNNPRSSHSSDSRVLASSPSRSHLRAPHPLAHPSPSLTLALSRYLLFPVAPLPPTPNRFAPSTLPHSFAYSTTTYVFDKSVRSKIYFYNLYSTTFFIHCLHCLLILIYLRYMKNPTQHFSFFFFFFFFFFDTSRISAKHCIMIIVINI